MQEHIPRVSVDELSIRGVDVRNGSMLELAAGNGGYSTVFSALSQDFVATDIQSWAFTDDLAHIRFVVADASRPFPFPDGRFDLVYVASLIEHLPERESLYSECRRVVALEGHALFSFPPFWSLTLVGGHRFKPLHLVSERAAVNRASRLYGEEFRSYADDHLYPLTVRQVLKEIEEHDWRVVDRWARMWPINTARLPGIVADLLTWHVCILVSPA